MAAALAFFGLLTSIALIVAARSRKPLITSLAVVLGLITLGFGYLTIKDQLPVILVTLLAVALAGGCALAFHYIRRRF